jgi:methenyltetrahydrofolate cyclohydrolase
VDHTKFSINEFMNRLSSNSPTPGGGSIAGLSASLSSGLLLMVIKLTDKGKGIELKDYILELERIKDESLELINEDAEAFNQVMNAYRMPKSDEKKKAKRHEHIQITLKNASITPLKTMKLGFRLLEIGQLVAMHGNPNASSDAGVAALMALSAVKGGNYNVLINAKMLEDKDYADSLKKEAFSISTKSTILADEIESIINNKI